MKNTNKTLEQINKYKLFLNQYSNIEFSNYPKELKDLTIQRIKEKYGRLTNKQIYNIKY